MIKLDKCLMENAIFQAGLRYALAVFRLFRGCYRLQKALVEVWVDYCVFQLLTSELLQLLLL